MFETPSTKHTILCTTIAIGMSLCLIYLMATPTSAETLSLAINYNEAFTHFEPEDQVRVIAQVRSRIALFNTAIPVIKNTDIFKQSLPLENLSSAIATGVMVLKTNSFTLEKIPKGYSISTALTGSLDTETLEMDIEAFMANPFLLDNAMDNRKQEDVLLDSLRLLTEKYSAAQEQNNQKSLVPVEEILASKRHHLVNQLAAIALIDSLIVHILRDSILDPGETIKRLNQAVALDDRNAWFYLHRGRVFSHLKDWIAASADFDRAVILNPYLIYSYEYQGDIYTSIGEFKEAINSYSKAIALDRGYQPTLMKRGRAYQEMGLTNRAVKDFTHLIGTDPNSPAAYLARGEALYASGAYIASAADFSKIVDLNPKDGAAYARRGQARQAAGLNDKACEDIKMACELGQCDDLRLASRDGKCHILNLGAASKWSRSCYEQIVSRKWHQAIQAATLAIAYNPKAVDPYTNRAWAYAEIGEFRKALEDANRALTISPKNALAFNNRGLVYEKKGDKVQATRDYYKACELGLRIGCNNYLEARKPPQNEESPVERLLRQSSEKYGEKNWAAAIHLSTLAIRQDPENQRAYTIRAAAIAQAGRFEEALDDCNKAIRINPSFALAYNNRGYALENMGKREEALVDYRVGCLLGSDLSCQNHTRLESAIR